MHGQVHTEPDQMHHDGHAYERHDWNGLALDALINALMNDRFPFITQASYAWYMPNCTYHASQELYYPSEPQLYLQCL